MGIGFAVTEDFPYKDGYVTAKYGTSRVFLEATQCPPIHVSLIERGHQNNMHNGAKGIVVKFPVFQLQPAIANAYRRIDGEPRRSRRFNIQVGKKNRIFA